MFAQMCIVDAAGCASLRSSYLQEVRSVEIYHPFLQVDGFRPEVYFRGHSGRKSQGAGRVWKSQDPAYGLNDAPAAFYETPHGYLLDVDGSTKLVRLNLKPRAKGGAVSGDSRVW